MRWIVMGSLTTAVFLFSVAFALANLWIGLLASLLIGGFWMAGVRYDRNRLVAAGLSSLIVLAVVAVPLGVSPTMLLTGIALALFAWTIENVAQQLAAVSEVRDEAELIKKHVQWAGGLIGLGWLLGMVALNFQLTLTFGWVLLLGVVVVFALSRFVRRLQQESPQ